MVHSELLKKVGKRRGGVQAEPVPAQTEGVVTAGAEKPTTAQSTGKAEKKG